VIEGVSSQFTGRCYELGLVNKAEAQFNGPLPDPLPGYHNVI
jgi:hypothetical protein